MSWDPTGIVVGDAFTDYVERLRDSWPREAEPSRNNGVPAGKRHFTTNT